MRPIDPVKARTFAVEVVQRLREAGHEALWAGGCVRDSLMGREPKDYDVATNATPDRIRDVFGRRRTLAIGASFGVITVVGPREAGQIDVATFRRDAAYSDGRHPDHVEFSSAEEDAQRRDFTINGLFFDPLEQRVIDYVGGQVDLQKCLVRAIGDPSERFAEDKLRMIRAVRFAATLGFAIDASTLAAVCQHASEIQKVSVERITEELRRMLVSVERSRAVELLRDARLLHEILPEAEGVLPRAEPATAASAFAWDRTLRVLERLERPSFAVAMAALLREIHLCQDSDETRLMVLCRRLRLANAEIQVIAACRRHESILRSASRAHWPKLQRVLIDPEIESMLNYATAVAMVHDENLDDIQFCRERLQWPAEKLNPQGLLSGNDLRDAGIPPGPAYKRLLDEIRDAQLMGELATTDDAIAWAKRQWDAQGLP